MLEQVPWLKVRQPRNLNLIDDLTEGLSLNTVCREACCPNQGECYSRGTATFLILGSVCTRKCAFCAVRRGKPTLPDPGEPYRLAQAVLKLGLKHVVVTSVTRDDLPDGGAQQFAAVIQTIKEIGDIVVECLVPDFGGNLQALEKVLLAGPDILGHNVETVPRLYGRVRPDAIYKQSLTVLEYAAGRVPVVKSGLMVGLGEEQNEVYDVFKNLRQAGCDAVTVGQYLAPSPKHLPVTDYITPEHFQNYAFEAYRQGFPYVIAEPLVRSSYYSESLWLYKNADLLTVMDTGYRSYIEVLELQRAVAFNRANDKMKDSLVLAEHISVITVGRGGLDSDMVSETGGLDVIKVDRGGAATYHGPGQLVVYPVLDIKGGKTGGDIPRYVRMLEEVMIHILAAYGVNGSRRDGYPGVWVKGKKIGFIGVNLTGGITTHGFALNINTDLKNFINIIPCGIWNCKVTNLVDEVTGIKVDFGQVKAQIIEHFQVVFGYKQTAQLL